MKFKNSWVKKYETTESIDESPDFKGRERAVKRKHTAMSKGGLKASEREIKFRKVIAAMKDEKPTIDLRTGRVIYGSSR